VAQMALAEDEDVVETLSPDRADEAFHEGILPGCRLQPVPLIHR
jgi:hypothetical protein